MTEATELQRPQERESISREIVIHFIRHGEAEYTDWDDIEGQLTKKGKEQTKQRAQVLFNELEDGSIIGFHSSPRRRSLETVQEIQTELQRLSKEQGRDLKIHNLNIKSSSRIGVDDQQTIEYLDLIHEQKKDPIDFWLKNPGESSEKIEKNFRSFLKKFSGLALRLSPAGPNLHLICVTHTGPSEVFVGKLLDGKHPGNLANCEEFIFKIPVQADKPLFLKFKNFQQEVHL